MPYMATRTANRNRELHFGIKLIDLSIMLNIWRKKNGRYRLSERIGDFRECVSFGHRDLVILEI